MKRLRLSTLLLLAACLVNLRAQTAATKPNQQPPAQEKPKKVSFHSDFLDLTLDYPATMTAETLPSLEAQHAKTLAKYPDESEESKKADACTDVALKASRQDSPKTTGTFAFYNDARGMQIHVDPAIKATIVISRIGIACLPEQYKNNPDDVAIGLAQQLEGDKTLKIIDQAGWFDFGKLHIHFEAAQNAKPAEKPEDQRWILSTAFISNGSVVNITFESNDLDFLNEMIGGKAAIGEEHKDRFFPADIGAGTPVDFKP